MPKLGSYHLSGYQQAWKYRRQTLFPFSDKEGRTLKNLQELLIPSLILALPSSKVQYTIDIHESHRNVWGLLPLRQPYRPPELIGYQWKSLPSAYGLYQITELKFFPVVRAPLLLLPYLEVNKYTSCSDRSALCLILKLMAETLTLSWCKLQLLQYEFDLVHPPEADHQPSERPWWLGTDALRQGLSGNEFLVMWMELKPVILPDEIEDEYFVCSIAEVKTMSINCPPHHSPCPREWVFT